LTFAKPESNAHRLKPVLLKPAGIAKNARLKTRHYSRPSENL
jgi:hypothetical protein